MKEVARRRHLNFRDFTIRTQSTDFAHVYRKVITDVPIRNHFVYSASRHDSHLKYSSGSTFFFSCVSRRIMETTRMRIVALLLYSIAISKVCLVSAVSTPFDTSNMCKGGWTYSYGSCYSPEQLIYENVTEAQKLCKYMDEDSHMLVLNTKEEIVAGIQNGVFYDGAWACQGMISYNNGTTFTKLDGSTEETYIETLKSSYYDSSSGNRGMVCCYIYVGSTPDSCYVYYPSYLNYFYCEKPGPYMNSGPCDIKINRKPRRGATRKISFKNTERDMCYIELSRSHFRPAQIKIYGYDFPSTSRTCSQGFFVQNNGKVLDYLLKEKLTCGSDGGPNGPLIKKRSGRGDKIRIYVAMNGDGRRVWFRTKGRNFWN